MGAQESALRGKADLLEIGEEYSHTSGIYKLWSHVNPCTKNKRTSGTIFTKKFAPSSGDEEKIFENGVKLMKQLRHPGVVTFLECSKQPGQISLMTERVQVLDLCIDTLSFVEIHSGLRQILETLIFLHEKARISHNNISPASIFVCSNGEWKLGGLEFAHSLDTQPNYANSELFKKASDPVFRLEDEKDSKSSSPLTPDAYSFGRLIEYVLKNHCPGEESDEEVSQALKSVASGLVSVEATDLTALLRNYAFSNELTAITDFLGSIHLKGDEEKELFFKDIEARLRSLPVRVVSRRLCRLALSRYVLLEPLSHTHLYPALLVPAAETGAGILPLELYRTHLIPEVVRVFCVKEVSVRLGLLAHFDRYVTHIPRDHLERFVLEEVLLGAHDVDDRLVAASLRAMADLVGLLGAEVVCDWKLTKTFVDSTAKSSSRASSVAPTTAAAPPRLERPRKQMNHERMHLETEDECDSTPFVPRPPAQPPTENYSQPTVCNGQAEWDGAADWSDDWNTAEKEEKEEEEVENAGRPEASEEKVVQPLKLQSFVPAKPIIKKENSIGSTFEIKAAKAVEDDFFADMAPEIKTSGTLIDKLIAMKEEEEKKANDTFATSTASKFAMAPEVDEATADWGDDGWDEEEEAQENYATPPDDTTKAMDTVEGAPNTDDPPSAVASID